MNSSPNTNNNIIKDLISSGDTIIDINSDKKLLFDSFKNYNDLKIHFFEPFDDKYKTILSKLSRNNLDAKVFPNRYLIGNKEENKKFFINNKSINIFSTTLDRYCLGSFIKSIDLVILENSKLDFDLIQSGKYLLENNMIKFILIISSNYPFEDTRKLEYLSKLGFKLHNLSLNKNYYILVNTNFKNESFINKNFLEQKRIVISGITYIGELNTKKENNLKDISNNILYYKNISELKKNYKKSSEQNFLIINLYTQKEILDILDYLKSKINYFECILLHISNNIVIFDKYLNHYNFIRLINNKYEINNDNSISMESIYFKKPTLTMNSLGEIGRFGNSIFQYAFLKIYSREYSLNLELPENWIGRKIFKVNETIINKQYITINEEIGKHKDPKGKFRLNLDTPIFNSNINGYFQYHTSFFKKYKEYFESLFIPNSNIKELLDEKYNNLFSEKTVIGLHIRKGDYIHVGLFITPIEWYLNILEEIWTKIENPVLYIASDEIENYIDSFKKFNPITSKDLNIKISEFDFYKDFYILTKSNIMIISNSTFSFSASMLNSKCKTFYKPNTISKNFKEFDPWNSEILFYENPKENLVKINEVNNSQELKSLLSKINNLINKVNHLSNKKIRILLIYNSQNKVKKLEAETILNFLNRYFSSKIEVITCGPGNQINLNITLSANIKLQQIINSLKIDHIINLGLE